MSNVNRILISELQKLVNESKSESSARNYTAMLKALKSHLHNDSLLPDDITPEFVKAFGLHMLDHGIAPSTAKLYQQMLRALLNQRLGRGYKALIKEAFKEVGSQNETCTNQLSGANIKTLISDKLQDNISLKKTRDIFLFSLYGGGCSLDDMKSMARSGFDIPAYYLPQQKEIILRFGRYGDKSFSDYILSLSEKDYIARLDAIGRMLMLKSPLRPQSAAEGWVNIARGCGLSQDVISRCLDIRPADVDDTVSKHYRTVANHIHDLHPHWYCIRCIDESAAVMSMQLKQNTEILSGECFDTFIPPQPRKKQSRADNVLRDILFIYCPAEYAVAMKKILWPKAFIYSNRSTGNPSIIPDNEMKMFMLLSNIASDTVEYFFPEVNENASRFNTNDRVTIVGGNFSGQVGVVKKLSDNHLKVFIKIEAINGAIVTAEIHKSFLKPSDSL